MKKKLSHKLFLNFTKLKTIHSVTIAFLTFLFLLFLMFIPRISLLLRFFKLLLLFFLFVCFAGFNLEATGLVVWQTPRPGRLRPLTDVTSGVNRFHRCWDDLQRSLEYRTWGERVWWQRCKSDDFRCLVLPMRSTNRDRSPASFSAALTEAQGQQKTL